MELMENYLKLYIKLIEIAQLYVTKDFPASGHIGSIEAVQGLPLQLYIKQSQGYISNGGQITHLIDKNSLKPAQS